ncbi:putative MFS family arabinose efflux permease [Sinobaca qinghaiensis]|uniref:Putative MFS family arabinose efflux permease n=1 Tax=Sinobaca qinghaiensis TaxID=342944 RepID=A0A419V4J7_9BACL|nr:MFS transporter [Sinobaca qinghaiensis]RKD73413.1 putative MFS family arabinose efflux permease [Sinobaca qinghaiensis]
MSPTNSEKIWTKPFWIALINNFFVFLAFYALLTILPIFVLQELGGTEGQAGLATTIFLISAILTRAFAGRIIESFGKKKMLMVSVLLFALSMLLYLFAHELVFLLALRFFHGIWFSIATTVLLAAAADLVPASRKGEGLGYFIMSMNLAVVAGPFIALTAVRFVSYTVLFGGLAAVSILGFVLTFLIRLPAETPTRQPVFKQLALSDLVEKRAFPPSAIGFLAAFSYAGVISFISVYAESINLFHAVNLFFVCFAAVMLLSRPFTGRLFDRAGPAYVIIPSLLVFSAGLFLLSTVTTAAVLLLAGGLIGLGYGSILPSLQTMAIQASPPERTSHATATFFMLFDSGIAVGSFVLGTIASLMTYSYVYIICGTLVLATLGIYMLVYRNRLRLQSAH